jgi:predicted RNA-binding protein YlqC (UPF0109 family)
MDKQRRSSESDSSQSHQEGSEFSEDFGSVEADYEETERVPHAGPETAAEDLAEYILRALAPEDENLKISHELLAPSHIKIIASCDQTNTGRLIGRGGKTINALRTLARAIAQLHGKRVDIEIST